jgi:hypothetical protein
MRKNLAITLILISMMTLSGCKKQEATQVEKTPPVEQTSSWQTHQNDKYGIEFQYPKYIEFDNGAETKDGWYTVGGNYDKDGDNYFNFTVFDKAEGMENINSLKYRDKNLFAPDEITFQDGKFIQTDGYGTADYYFVDAYYEGKDYVYHFMMSRPKHSEELLTLFEEILATAKLTK